MIFDPVSGLWLPERPVIERRAPGPLVKVPYYIAAIPGMASALKAAGAVVPAASIVFTDNQVNLNALTTYNFTADFGTAVVGRRIAVGIHSVDSTAGRTINSCSIGGSAATQVAQFNSADAVLAHAALFIRQVDTGGAGQAVQVVWNGGAVARCAISVYALYDLLSSTPTDTGTSGASPPSDTLNIDAGGVAIGIATFYYTGGVPTSTWTNLTENLDTSLEATVTARTAASAAFAAAQSALAITCTPSNSTSEALALASFR